MPWKHMSARFALTASIRRSNLRRNDWLWRTARPRWSSRSSEARSCTGAPAGTFRGRAAPRVKCRPKCCAGCFNSVGVPACSARTRRSLPARGSRRWKRHSSIGSSARAPGKPTRRSSPSSGWCGKTTAALSAQRLPESCSARSAPTNSSAVPQLKRFATPATFSAVPPSTTLRRSPDRWTGRSATPSTSPGAIRESQHASRRGGWRCLNTVRGRCSRPWSMPPYIATTRWLTRRFACSSLTTGWSCAHRARFPTRCPSTPCANVRPLATKPSLPCCACWRSAMFMAQATGSTTWSNVARAFRSSTKRLER